MMDKDENHENMSTFMNWWYWTNRSLKDRGGKELCFADARAVYATTVRDLLNEQQASALVAAA
jgi:hypothetical protein